MKPVQTGDILCCNVCGAEVMVTKACGCDDCDIVCCGKSMKPKDQPKPGSCCCGR